MSTSLQISLAKRKRMLKTIGLCPAGYTLDDLECMNKNLILRQETMLSVSGSAARKRYQAKERRSVRRFLLRFWLVG